MIKMNEIELELISDIKMPLFIEKGMRESIFYIAKRYNKANNKYMTDYDISKVNIYIADLDANYKSSSVAVPTGPWYIYIPMSGVSTSTIHLLKLS